MRLKIVLFSNMVLGFGILSSNPAAADNPPVKAADSMSVSPGNVDLRTGRYVADIEDLSIGGGLGGIQLKRQTGGEHGPGAHNQDPFGQYSSNWDYVLKQYRACQLCTNVSTVSISVEGVSYNFYDQGGGVFKLISNAGFAQLSRVMVGSSSNYYILTTNSGAVAVFQSVPFPGSPSTFEQARPVTITHPNGVIYSFTYSGNALSSVTSNAGYKLVFEHNYSSQPIFITKACVINLSVASAGTSCPSGVPTTSYSYSGQWMTSATDRNQAIWSYSSNFVNWSTGFTEQQFRPGQSNPFVTNTWGVADAEHDVVVSQDFADGRHFDYTYTIETYAIKNVGGDEYDQNFNLGTGWTVNGSQTTRVDFGSDGFLPPNITPTPVQVTDPIGRVFKWTYPSPNGGAWNGGAILQSRTFPEGNSESYTYDAFRNTTQVRKIAKPGTGLTDIVQSYTFGNCGNSNLVACNLATQETDANGNVTDKTYSSVHGGLLTLSLPADADGIRPVTRYAYVQRYAWLSNGSGGYARAGSPIWLLSEERTCRKTATSGNACGGGAADEVITTYDYGPDTGAVGNNLWLRGKVVTAQDADGVIRSYRTCYGYDTLGNNIWETSPRAGLSACY